MPSRPASGLLLPYLGLLGLALMWGLSFFFIKVAVGGHDLSPTALVLIRVASATLTLGGILAVTRRRPLPPAIRRELPALVGMAVLSSVIPFVLIAWGELYISSGTASILNATTPLWTAVLAYWVTPAERPSRTNYLGVAAGFIGTAVLVGPELIRHGLNGTTLGVLAVLIGALSYAAAALLQRRRLAGAPPIAASLWQMGFASLFMIPIAAPTLPAVHLHAGSLAAALILGVGGSGVAYILYYYLLNSLGATRASTVTFLLPVTAVFWGAFLLRETVTVAMLAGMAIILGGIFLTSRNVRPRARPAASPVPSRPSLDKRGADPRT
ncbi:MAG: DMT family transporter [Candidatus Dormibacteraceae bacterium]